MKILLTGSAGFIGSALSIRLLEDGHHVLGIDNHNEYYDPELKERRLERFIEHENYKHQRFSITDNYRLEEAFDSFKPEIVINLAAQAGVRYSLENPSEYISTNLSGFANILEHSKQFNIKHLIYASSSSVYGGNKKIPFSVRDNADWPISLYAATKRSNEMLAHSYSALFNLPTTGLRFFTVYGPWGRPDMALFLFTKAILNGETIDVFNNGNMMRDFTYIDDIVESIYRLLKKPPKCSKQFDSDNPDPSFSWAPFRIFNIGNSSPTPLLEYIEAIENALGIKSKRNYMPIQPGDVPDTYADTSSLEKYINFKPATSVENGVNNFISWYLEFYLKLKEKNI